MAKHRYVFNAETFLKGLSKSYDVGAGLPRMDGINLFKELGYMSAGNTPIIKSNGASFDQAPSVMVLDNTNLSSSSTSILWGAGATKLFRYLVDADSGGVAFDIDDNFDKGGAIYNAYLYLATTNDIGRLALTQAADPGTLAANWDNNYLSTTPTGNASLNDSTAKHPMLVKNGYLWFLDGRYVGKLSTAADGSAGVYTKQALDLEPGWVGISFDEYGLDMVIGAIKYPEASALYGTTILEGAVKSKLIFWDTNSSSFYKPGTLEIDGRLVWVKNKQGILYVLVQHYGEYELLYYDGNTLQSIKRWNFRFLDTTNYFTPDASAEPAKAIMGNLLAFGINSGAGQNSRIMTYGAFDGDLPNALLVPCYALSSATIKCIVNGKNDGSFYVSIDTGTAGTSGIYRIASPYKIHSNDGDADPLAYVFELPAINEDGKLQQLDRLTLYTKPIASGDKLDISKKVDNGSAFDTWKSFDYAVDGATGYKVFADSTMNFRDLKLRFSQGANDDVRIRSIVVDTHDVEEI